MLKNYIIVVGALLSFASTGCASREFNTSSLKNQPPPVKEEFSVKIEEPKAGIDYPTDSPGIPNKSVLVINKTKRVLVEKDADISRFSPITNAYAYTLTKGAARAYLIFEKAQPGLDFPFINPPPPGVKIDPSLVDFWIFTDEQGNRHRVDTLQSIEFANPAIDFSENPVPEHWERKYFVAIIVVGDEVKRARLTVPPQPSGSSAGNQ